MTNSKLLEIIRAFDENEFYRLGLFLRSPYFQEKGISKDEMQLFVYLETLFPDFPAEEIEQSKVYERLFPGQPFIVGKLGKMMSGLLKQIERFLIQLIQEEETDSFKKTISLAAFFRKKKMSRLYGITFKKLKRKQATIPRKNKEDLYHDFLLEREIAEHQILYNKRKADLNLPATLKSLDVFYLATKLEYSCGLLSQSNFHIPVDLRDSLSILEKIAPSFEEDNFLGIPLIKTYAQMFVVLQDMNNLEAYAKLERLLEESKEELPLDQLKALQAFCRSFYIHQFNHGNHQLLEKAHQLYKTHLEEGYLLQNGGLLAGNFRNMVVIGLRQKEYEWVATFLETYKDKIIGTEFPQDAYHFNMAHYYFELKDYESALNYLVDNYEDLYYHIGAKRMEIKIYYEQDSVLLEPKMDAFKIFIHRLSNKKLVEMARKGNNNFINALKQIIATATRYDTKRIARIKEKIAKQEMIIEKNWLLEKIEEL